MLSFQVFGALLDFPFPKYNRHHGRSICYSVQQLFIHCVQQEEFSISNINFVQRCRREILFYQNFLSTSWHFCIGWLARRQRKSLNFISFQLVLFVFWTYFFHIQIRDYWSKLHQILTWCQEDTVLKFQLSNILQFQDSLGFIQCHVRGQNTRCSSLNKSAHISCSHGSTKLRSYWTDCDDKSFSTIGKIICFFVLILFERPKGAAWKWQRSTPWRTRNSRNSTRLLSVLSHLCHSFI